MTYIRQRRLGRTLLLARVGLLASVSLLAGCSQTFWTSTVSRTKPLASSDILLTTADLRAVTRVQRAGKTITCAEPSPDVAKIASASFDGSLAASASSVGNVANPEITLALAAARAEGLAQLGQRLATIQLLRDGLYRACEGYANGAINEKIYATILSRYDDVMITMLLGEFAGAKPSPLPAILAGSASGSSMAFTGPGDDLKQQLEKIEAAQAEKNTTDQQVAAKKAEIAAAPQGEDTSAKQGELAALETKGQQQDAKIEQLEADAASMSVAYARAQAGASVTAPGVGQVAQITGTDNGISAAVLYGMQKNYLDDFNLDALFVGCLAKDDPPKVPSGTESSVSFCDQLVKDDELVKGIANLKAIDVILRDVNGDETKLEDVQKILAKMREIEQSMNGGTQPGEPQPIN